MTGRAPSRRPRSRSRRSGAFFVAAALAWPALAAAGGWVAPASLAGQEPDSARIRPQAPDTLPRPLVQDTLTQDTAAEDTVVPPPRLPELEEPGPAGWTRGVWDWSRQDLLRLPDLTLLQLLERVPGVTPVRPASVGQAESASLFGSGTGAITYVVDGFEMDPMVSPTFDPSRLPLLALEQVRVERRVTGATVHIRTVSPTYGEPQSVIEAATGDLDTNLFRGTFLAPRVLGGPLAVGFERLASESAVQGGSNHTAGWLKYTFVRDSTGLQLEYRQSRMDRDGVGEPLVGERRDWALRARTRVGPVAGEVYGGATTVKDETGDVEVREGTPQGGLRLSTRFGDRVPVDLLAAFRLRSHPRLPRQEMEVRAWLAPAPWLGVGGGLVQSWWDGPPTTGRWSAEARLGPLVGLSAFAAVDRAGGPLIDGTADLRVDPRPGLTGFELSRDGSRVGLEWAFGGVRVGAAAVRTVADSVAGFGLAFDPTAPRFPAGEATGHELTVRIPTGFSPLWLEGWLVEMDAPAGWLYLPREQWRAALVYHHLPLPSGNLELYLRAEEQFRTGMTVPAEDGTLATVDAYRGLNLELTIRVVTVRAFLRWENMSHRLGQEDLPGFQLPGQHIVYGVKWQFLN